MRKLQIIKANEILVIASQNLGKLNEIAQVLSPYRIRCLSLSNWTSTQIEETGTTFKENAQLKALHAYLASNLPALADDSGLCIDLLNGEPGIHSSRWANDNYNNAFKIIKQKLKRSGWNGSSLVKARFVCHLCLAITNDCFFHFEGKTEGQIKFPQKGSNGFGYDPIFIADGDNLTFAELSLKEKKLKSHRGKALELLLNRVVIKQSN